MEFVVLWDEFEIMPKNGKNLRIFESVFEIGGYVKNVDLLGIIEALR